MVAGDALSCGTATTWRSCGEWYMAAGEGLSYGSRAACGYFLNSFKNGYFCKYEFK